MTVSMSTKVPLIMATPRTTASAVRTVRDLRARSPRRTTVNMSDRLLDGLEDGSC